MKFETYIPCALLQPYVRMLAISESDVANTFKVLPGTELVIGFQYKGKLSYLENDVSNPLATSGITGIRDNFRLFSNTADTGSVLVYFREGGAAAFFRQPIHELFGESLSLDNFMLGSELLLMEEKLKEAKTDLEKIATTEKFLLSKFNQTLPDLLVLSAISMIYKTKGQTRITELANALHISQSPLEKRFRKIVGTSPKKFSSIIRLNNLMNAYDPLQSLTQLGYEAGFYDQAHFIKEFRHFSGDSPEVFFSNR